MTKRDAEINKAIVQMESLLPKLKFDDSSPMENALKAFEELKNFFGKVYDAGFEDGKIIGQTLRLEKEN